MTSNPEKGSFVFKILIVLFVVILVLIIKIPDSIWHEEENEKSQSQFNMSSIYQAERQFQRLTQKFTTDKNLLLSELKKDSTLYNTQKLVKYTQQLKNTINKYLSNNLSNSLLTADQTIQTIIQDLSTNERYFKSDKQILNRADELRVKLSIFSSTINFPNYSKCAAYLDSLYQLRRDLSDYTLQTAAAHATDLTSNINLHVRGIELESFISEWTEVSSSLDEFRLQLKKSAISKNTSVGDRLKEFVSKVDGVINVLKSINLSEETNAISDINEGLNGIYQFYLNDFIITGKHGQYRLTLEDSMVLYISEENFLSPVSGKPYLIQINDDSSDVKIESPVLVEELLQQVKPIADELAKLEFISYYKEYSDSLQSVFQKSSDIRSKIRSLEITVKNKEIEEKVNKYNSSSEYMAAKNIREFIDLAGKSKSYSVLKEYTEKARNAVGIFEQIYSQQLFGNIDTLQADIKADLDEYNQILSEIKRLPKEIENFSEETIRLNKIILKLKQKSATNSDENLNALKLKLEESLLFVSTGTTQRVFGIFEKAIENFGYVYHNSKSWEEE